MLSRFAQRHGQQVLLQQRLVLGGVGFQLGFHFPQVDLLIAAHDQQPLDQIFQLPHVARPGIVAQPILGRHAEAPKAQPFCIHQ